jgi:hypothetical protein
LQGKARTRGLGFIILFFIVDNMLSTNPDSGHHNGGKKIKVEPLLLKKNIIFKLFQPQNTTPLNSFTDKIIPSVTVLCHCTAISV